MKNVDFSRANILSNNIIKCILLKGDCIHLYKGIIYFMILFSIKIKKYIILLGNYKVNIYFLKEKK